MKAKIYKEVEGGFCFRSTFCNKVVVADLAHQLVERRSLLMREKSMSGKKDKIVV